MKSFEQIDQGGFRLMITRRDASEILTLRDGNGWSLPTVEILPRGRVAEQLTAKVDLHWKFKTYLLFISRFASADRSVHGADYAVMESIEQNGKAPEGMCWLYLAESRNRQMNVVYDSNAIEKLLCQLNSYRLQSTAGPFGRPGWLKDLFTWVQQQLRPAGLRANGQFRQYSATPAFSLIRMETDGPAVWFKATGQPTVHELPITVALTRFFPENLPPILGVHQSWNGWISEEVSDATLDQFTESTVWERAAKALADLQIASIGKDGELLRAQCKDLRLSELANLVDPFVSRMGEFMTMQHKTSPPPLRGSELSFLATKLKEGCSLFHDLNFPDTLGHMDINPGNILICPDRCVFLDWAEASVTIPIISLEYLTEHFRRLTVGDTATCEKIALAYFRPWRSLFSPDQLSCAKEWSPLFALFAHAVSCNSWRLTGEPQSSSLTGYFRSLTRRMHREATQLAEGTERRFAPVTNDLLSSNTSIGDR